LISFLTGVKLTEKLGLWIARNSNHGVIPKISQMAKDWRSRFCKNCTDHQPNPRLNFKYTINVGRMPFGRVTPLKCLFFNLFSRQLLLQAFVGYHRVPVVSVANSHAAARVNLFSGEGKKAHV